MIIKLFDPEDEERFFYFPATETERTPHSFNWKGCFSYIKTAIKYWIRYHTIRKFNGGTL